MSCTRDWVYLFYLNARYLQQLLHTRYQLISNLKTIRERERVHGLTQTNEIMPSIPSDFDPFNRIVNKHPRMDVFASCLSRSINGLLLF